MTRKKVKLAHFTNDSLRKSTYKKRKKDLMKNMSELITLCKIDACAIMYSQYESQPKFKMIPEMEQRKNMVNQEIFLSQRTIKEVKKMTQFMFNNICGKRVVHDLNFWDLNHLNLLLNEKMSNIDKRMDAFAITPFNAQGALSSSSLFMVALPLVTMVMPKTMPRTGTEDVVQSDISRWIYELTNLHPNLAL
ncbi:hypothetical protein V6Z11_A03G096600 [Gossypium hirsutum]